MIALAMADGMLATVNVYAKPLNHEPELRVAIIICSLIALGFLYVAVFSEPSSASFTQRRIYFAAIGFGFAAIALICVVLVLLAA